MTRHIATVVPALLAGVAQAQVITIPWATIDGGGGTSAGIDAGSGAVITLSATLGQHDAVPPMTGVSAEGTFFVLSGGFWPAAAPPPPPNCGSTDFDGDGDTGTDLDIESFFACLGGDCCATCGSADFDFDGDTGTDLDIEAFFRVLGGGPC